MSTEIVKVDLSTGSLDAVDVDGKPHIVFRPAVEALGIDYSNQLKKLRSRSWGRVVLSTMRLSDDPRTREHAVVDVQTFIMWLATLNENNVSDEARPALVAFQKETAEAIAAYWTQGGAINPRATEDQLDAISRRAEAQMRILSIASGIVDPAWLEAKARHVAARALGEEPEIDPQARPLTVGEYLEERGVRGEALRVMSPSFGKRLKAAYITEYGREPGTVDRFVSGALRKVSAYTEKHRRLFDEVWERTLGGEE